MKVIRFSCVSHLYSSRFSIPAISFKSTYLGSEHNKLLPDKAHLEFVLNITKLMTLVDYSNLYGKLPHIDKYKEVVWPLPFDFVPNNVFDWEKYDINLTFGNKK